MKQWLFHLAVALALIPAVGAAQNLDENGKLPRATPESVGASSETLAEALKTLDAKSNRIDSIMLLRHGKVPYPPASALFP